jgi:hypothetical protein
LVDTVGDHRYEGRKAMTSQEPTDEAEEIVSTPATPGATALPTTDEEQTTADDNASTE